MPQRVKHTGGGPHGNASVVFGPVPSRRLGRSLGINNIPPKTCTYSCVYCQVGRTSRYTDERETYYAAGEVMDAVREKLREAAERGERIDYISFVPDGEPTLDVHLGALITLLGAPDLSSAEKTGRSKIAVITNATLLTRDDVKGDLMRADLVSVKVDAVTPRIWKRVDRPKGTLRLQGILAGVKDFARHYGGTLITETMLVRGLNDGIEEISGIARFLQEIDPFKSYISIPTRPPAEGWVVPAEEKTLSIACALFGELSVRAELLTGYEGNAFAFTGDVESDLLSITSVHPMREDAVTEYLRRAGAGREEVEKLILAGKLLEVSYNGETFFARKLR
jgi:wyosine [tRNA(Phe)-imidazoG37] synthetase (radical SAM superfamily)